MKTKVKIFLKDGCPRCPSAKELGEKLLSLGKKAEFFNISEVKGLTEAVIFNIMAAPSVLVTDTENREIVGWRGKTPSLEEIIKFL